MPTKMPAGVAHAEMDGGGFRRDRERRLVVSQSGFELPQSLQSQPEILMGFGVVGIDCQCPFVMEQRIGEIAPAAKHVGQMKLGLCIPLVEGDSCFEVKMGVFEIVETNVARPEQNVVGDRLACNLYRPADQIARLVGITKLAANHS